MYQTAGDVPGHPEKKHQDWFDEHDKHLKKPLKARNTSGQENLQCNTKLKKKKIQRQKCTRKTKSNWWKKNLKKKKTRGTPNCSRHEGHENILQSSDGNLHVWPQTKRIDTAKGSE